MADTTKPEEDASNEKHEPKVSQGEGGLEKEAASPSRHQLDSSNEKHEPKVSQGEGDLEKEAASPSRHQHDTSNEKHEPKVSQGEGDVQKEAASPSRHQRDSVNLSPGDTPKKTGRSSDCSVDHSPLHPHHQAKLGAKVSGVSSPAWEKKGLSDSAGRSRMKSTPRGSETPEKGTSLPKFGEWDENDPSAADGYTQLFNLVREERQGGTGATLSMSADNQRQFGNRGSKGCGCFPWSRN